MENSVRLALIVGAAALFAGCGGSQPPTSTQGALTQSRTIAQQADGRGATEAAGAKGPLIFGVADRNASYYYLYVWTYPRGHFVKKIARGYGGLTMCSDSAGNVWLTAARELDEFGRNGYFEKDLGDEGFDHIPSGCSVDPRSGNVAAINADDGDFVVYANGSGSGMAFSTGLYNGGYTCTYDDQGNLFGLGLNSGYKEQLVELPRGSSKVEDISLSASIGAYPWIQWDGQYLAIQTGVNDNTATINQVQVSGSNATVIGTTLLTSGKRFPDFGLSQFWIQGETIMESTGHDAKEIGVWNYPNGGKPIRLIKDSGGNHVYYIHGLTVSVAPK